jgi:predicted ATPase/class 3 adenylate cyclase
MQFDVLGPLRVVDDAGNALVLPSAAQRRLMSLLILRAGSVVPSDVLEEHLELSGGALRTAISRLRRVLGYETLVTAPPGYELRSDQIDAIQFARLVASGTRRDMESALALWRGDAYAEFADEPWAITEVHRLATLRTGAVEDLVELMLAAQEWTTAIATVELLIAREPFRDRPRGLLMRALAGSGRRTEALRAFHAYRSHLAAEIGTEPAAALVALDRQIAGGDAEVDMPPIVVAPFDAPGVFLMSDIVGSTRLWLAHPEAMGSDLVVHDEIMRRAISDHDGVTVATAGDSFTGAFDRPDDAVDAAIAAQRALAATEWQSTPGIRVRIAVHLGVAQRRGNGWYGAPLNETARMMAAGHGGQIVVSEPLAAELAGRGLLDLGEHRLRDLDGMRRLYQVTAPELPEEFPSLRSLGRYVTTLPPQRTALIGRDTLIGEIRGRLIDHPLVSLIGPAGVGKTRAAIEAAGRELATFDDGVFFVDLTAATTDADVLGAFVTAIKATGPPDRAVDELLADHLGQRNVLLVVDNCEHVIDGAAEAIDLLLNRAAGVRMLATSREALRVRGEQCVPVPSLDVDGPESDGVRLLAERAVAAGAGDVVDDPALAEIARRLDGIPLAIELAAAQLGTFTPAQVVEHLEDRFRLLTRGHRPAPARQRTLEGAIAWSYELLSPTEQHAFRALSVAAGPFTLGTAARVLGGDELDAAAAVDSLVAKSLIAPIRFDDGSRGYAYLESLREFGRRALTGAHEATDARLALEAALLPSARLAADWTALANEYLSAGDLTLVIEDTTRREAAGHALAAGRLDTAALIFSSCAFRDTPGALTATLQLVSPLVARRHDLDPLAWRAAAATKVLLERLTRRYEACITTSMQMLELLDADDPARHWFDTWRCALITAVAPAAGLAEIDSILDRVRAAASPPHDWALSQMLLVRATGLAMLRRLSDAHAAAIEGLEWAGVGRESRDQALAMVLWLAYLTGDGCDGMLLDLVARQSQQLGLAELCAAPAALAAEGSVEDRASLLVGAARRRPSTDVTTPFLLAFAWLAVEEGELTHAAELVACAEIYDSSTEVALVHVIAHIRGWTDDTWARECDAAIAEYLHPDHESASRQGHAVLAAEIEAWEHRLALGRDDHARAPSRHC